MAEVTFTPPQAPGATTDALYAGVDAAQSWMNRAQNMRIQKQAAERAQEIYEVGRPVMQAKAQADYATAQSNLNAQQRLFEVQKNFAEDKKAATQELIEATQHTTYQEQADALSTIAQKYSYFDLVPEGKAFLNDLRTHYLQTSHSAILDMQTKAAMARVASEHEMRMGEIEARGEQTRETYQAIGKGLTVQQKNLAAADELEAQGNHADAEALRNYTKNGRGGKGSTMAIVETIERLSADPHSDPAVVTDLKNILAKQGSWAPQKQSEFERNLALKQKAIADGDYEKADALDARNRALAFKADLPDTYPTRAKDGAQEPPSFLKRAFDKVRSITGDPVEAPKAPSFPAGTRTVTVGGREYKVSVDAHGNRAYYNDQDGKYYPLK